MTTQTTTKERIKELNEYMMQLTPITPYCFFTALAERDKLMDGSKITKLAPRPWAVDPTMNGFHWKNSLSIVDAEGGEVAILTRGYQGDEKGDGCPSFENAELIVKAVNAYRT